MQAVADAVILSTGWTRRFIAVAAGACGALALAPVSFAPALVVTLIVAVWLLDGASSHDVRRRWPGLATLWLAFGAGWWIGFGYFLGGLWWLGAAFLADPAFAWALPLGVIGMPVLLAFFTGAGFVFARLLWTPGFARIFALALSLGLAEWARGTFFSGFPWNAFGMALGDHLVTAQPVALFGLDGLTVVTIAIFAAPATLFDRTDGRLSLAPTITALASLALVGAYGSLRLAQKTPSDVAGVVVRIMQPGLTPVDKFVPENKDAILARYIALSRRDDEKKGVKLDDVTMLVWPESAFPVVLTRDPRLLSTIGAFLPAKTTLVTGAARREDRPPLHGSPAYSDYFNAVQVVSSGGTIIDGYDKIHLVPFGEYLPLSSVLGRLGLRNFVSVPGGFEPGSIRRALQVPGLPPAIPLVCYEAIFPGEVGVSTGSARPGFILNVTNDGWFGMTPGPAQHFAQARLRTIEQGLPMVRAAATGISAILDPYGRVRELMPLGAEGILDGTLPGQIAPPFYAKVGPPAIWIVWLTTFALYLSTRYARRLLH